MSDCDHLFEHTGKCCKCDFDAMAQIEHLQRKNEELSKDLRVMEANYDCTVDLLEQTRAEREVLKAAAITPEMRERIERKLADMQAESPLPIGGELVDLLRDLLGEQG